MKTKNQPKNKNFNDLKIGETASFERQIIEKDLIRFAEISGDYNPLHLDKKYAQKTVFKDRIVYGMFLGALVSRLIGMELPGRKALLVKECLEFKKPARVGDKILLQGRIVHKSPALRLLEITVKIMKAKELLVSGTVFVKMLR